MKGPCFEEAMAHLECLGIREVSRNISADDLSRRVRESIIQPFRELPQDQLSQDNSSEIKSQLVYGVESWLVEAAELRMHGCQIPESSPQGSQLGNGFEHNLMNLQPCTPPGTDRTEPSIDIRVTEKSRESDIMSNRHSHETFDPNFDVGEYLNFMPPPEPSIFSQALAEEDSVIGDFSQFEIW